MKMFKWMMWFFIGSCVLLLVLVFGLFMGGDSKEVKELKYAYGYDIPEPVATYVKSNYPGDIVEVFSKIAYDCSLYWERLDVSEIRGIVRSATGSSGKKYEQIEETMDQIFGSLEFFPVPEEVWIVKKYVENDLVSEEVTERRVYDYQLYDDFGEERNYKVTRPHYGNDLVASRGVPLVSMTDGYIKNYGWNENGGWRIGVETDEGAYFYYAHMSSYAAGLRKGQRISAGDLIGYVGDSGYGPEGTTGMFITHLHFQIGVMVDDRQEDYLWMDPQIPLKMMEDSVKVIEHISEIHVKKKDKDKDKKKKDSDQKEEGEVDEDSSDD